MTTTKQLPVDVERDFDALRKRVEEVHAYWAMIRELFSSGKERLQLLNESAGNFFFFVQRSFLDSLLLGLSRLTDDPGSGDRENLVLQRLATAIGKAGHRDLARRLRSQSKRINVAVAELRKYRDTVVAHSDRKTALGERQVVEIPVQSVEQALSAVRDFMNEIDREFHDTTRRYEWISFASGVSSLITLLEDAHEFRKEEYGQQYRSAMTRRMQRDDRRRATIGEGADDGGD